MGGTKNLPSSWFPINEKDLDMLFIVNVMHTSDTNFAAYAGACAFDTDDNNNGRPIIGKIRVNSKGYTPGDDAL